MNVDEMLDEMTPAEFTELQAAAIADPGDGWRQNAQLAGILWKIFQIVGLGLSGGEYKIPDRDRDSFLPQWQRVEDEPETEPAEDLAPSVVDAFQEFMRRG